MGKVISLTREALEAVAPVDFESVAIEVIEFLNWRAGKRFPSQLPGGRLSKSAGMVLRLLRDGYEADDIKSVIAMKSRQWRDSERWRVYLRPKTLFGPENFEQYIGELAK